MKNTKTLSQTPAAIAKRAKRASMKTAAPKKAKKSAIPERIARPGSCVDNIYQVLRDEKPHLRTELFGSIAHSQSQYQIITDLRKLGTKLNLFEIELVNAETREYQLKPLAAVK